MRRFRHTLLRRLIAAALAVAVAVPLVPAAGAQSGRLLALRTVLDDVQAFDAALDAAREAEASPLSAFAEAYAQASTDGMSAEAVRQLLGAEAMTAVLPPAPDRATAAPDAATPSASGPAGIVRADRAPPLVLTLVSIAGHTASLPPRPAAASAQPRAP